MYLHENEVFTPTQKVRGMVLIASVVGDQASQTLLESTEGARSVDY